MNTGIVATGQANGASVQTDIGSTALWIGAFRIGAACRSGRSPRVLGVLGVLATRINDDETTLGWSPAPERKPPANHRAAHD